MANSHQTSAKSARAKRKPSRLIIALFSSLIIIALLAAYAFFITPEIFKPREITITGTITASDVALDKITFINTGCGTKSEANISSIGENLWAYTISLENGYSYNVTIAWNNIGTELNEAEMGKLVVDTFADLVKKDWILQP
jgi:hypothetical protein